MLPNSLSLPHPPPVSPELNPVKNVWEFPRGNRLPFQLYRTQDDITQACRDARN